MPEFLDDLKKTLAVFKKAQVAAAVLPPPRYFDALEQLNQRLHPAKQKLKIVAIEPASPNVKLFRGVSTRDDHPLAPFRAGQYIGVKVMIDGVITGRAYSLISSPNNLAFYEFAVKDLGSNGFVSHHLCNHVKVGDILEITEPKGDFYYNSVFHGSDLVFIAGGCGVTPFLSLMRGFTELDLPVSMHLIFGCLTEADMLFKNEFTDLARRNPRIRIDYVLSSPNAGWTGLTGFVTKDILQKAVPDWTGKMVYFVGPEMMRELVLQALHELHVPSHRILCEVNVPPADPTKILGWPAAITAKSRVNVTVEWLNHGQSHSQVISVQCTEPLLNAIERAKLPGVIVPNACRAGACALCRTKLRSGSIFVPPYVHIREADRKMGYIHPCTSYAITDLHLELYNA
jgi:ferredoxin-NADP reductase